MPPFDVLPRYDDGGPSDRRQELEPISPELALVDPELAARARRMLPDVYALDSFGAAPAAAVVLPVPDPGRRVVGSFPSRRAHDEERTSPPERPSVLRYIAAAAVLALLLAALGGETYLWTASVRAGGTQSRPEPPPPPAPSSPSPTARIFTWPPAPGATAYRFSLYRDGTGVLVARTQEPRFELTERWRYGGLWYVLVRGPYLWVVTPLRPTAAGLRAGPPIVQATYEFAG